MDLMPEISQKCVVEQAEYMVCECRPQIVVHPRILLRSAPLEDLLCEQDGQEDVKTKVYDRGTIFLK